MVLQGGAYHWLPTALVLGATGWNGDLSFVASELSWQNGAPDFSDTADPMQFGVITTNGTGGSGQLTTTGGIDSWSVTITLVAICIDDDDDGYGSPGDASCSNGAAEDCNDGDPDISPAAFEIPGNLVDENCDGDLGPCCPSLDWRNHGQYVRCVAQDAEALVEAGMFTQDEADALVSSSAQTDVGKKDFVPDPGQCAE